jgi:transcriptional regulator with XRE-family HTH domain
MGDAMTFGEKMLALMTERDISLRKLAKAIPADAGLLSKISRDLTPPSEKMAARIDEALDARGTLAALRPPTVRERLNGRLTPDDEERILAAARAPWRHDPGVVDALANVLDGQRRIEDAIGSAPLLQPVTAQFVVVRDLVLEARGDMRTDVVRLGSQWAQFAAWLHANLGHLDKAGRLYRVALELAAEIDDADMIATALNMQGHAAWLAGKIGPMLGLSEAAQRDRRASSGVLALAKQQEARARALAGDAEMTDRKLDEASALTLAAAEHPEDEPPWIYFFNPEMLTMQRARAYLYLPDRQGDAAELLTAGLDGLPTELRRSEWAAFYLVDLARAFRALSDEAEAQRVVEEIEELARQIGSKRLALKAAALR